MTGFTIQETIISGLYLYEARKVLRPGQIFQKRKISQVLKHLIWVNAFIIFLDAALLSTEFANLFSIQTVFKAAVYSVKLRFEFFVLNQLIDLVGAKAGVFSLGEGDGTATSGTARSGQGHQLGSMNGRPYQYPGNNYTAFASPGVNPALKERKVDGVLRTTEVSIHGLSDEMDDEIQAETPHAVHEEVRIDQGFATRSRGRPPSPTSSEIEFAAKGAYPS